MTYLKSNARTFRVASGSLKTLILTLAALSAPALAHAGAEAEPSRGAAIFQSKCAVCHDITSNKIKVGPPLHNVMGHKAGTSDVFPRYYALKDANWTWDERMLDAYLTDPQAFTKSRVNKMSSMILKLPDKQDRADVIEFLKSLK